MNILELIHVHKVYSEGAVQVEALRDVSLTVRAGEFVAITGPSGCGKSTLLNLAGAVDVPTRGTVAIAGQDTSTLNDYHLTQLRRRHIGYVFQLFNLLPTLTLRENVALPLVLQGHPSTEAGRRAGNLLVELGLAGLHDRYPHQLSGGEMQRVAIARAIVHSPALVLADEPTGNLDSATGAAILKVLAALSHARRQTVLLATHSLVAASACDRVVSLRDGLVLDGGL